MTDTPTARFAAMLTLEEGELGMLPEHRQRRRLRAATRLLRIHVRTKARELGMLADDWQESTAEANDPEDGAMAVRVSARFTPAPPARFGDGGEDLAAFQGRINDMIVGQIHAQENYGIPARFLAGDSSAEAFRAWEAPRRAAYEAARDAAIERLAPAFEQLGRMIDNIANPPRYIDEEHVITADHLAGLRPGQIWLAPHVERHTEALAILDRLGDLLDAMHTGPDMAGRATTVRSVLVHHIDAVRRLVLHHHDLEDPAGAEERARARRLAGRIPDTIAFAEAMAEARTEARAPERCQCGAIEWPAALSFGQPMDLVRAQGWAHRRLPARCNRMLRDLPQA